MSAKPEPFWIARIAAGEAPRLRNPGESVEDYRVAMGWDKPKAADAILYEHEDGRYAVAASPEAATFAAGDPKWHRVGPAEIHIQTPRRGVAILRNVIESLRADARYVDEEGDATDALEELLRFDPTMAGAHPIDEFELGRAAGRAENTATPEEAYAEGRKDERDDCVGLIAWAYGKLHHTTYAKQEDTLMLDRIKLLLEHGIHA